MSQASPEALPLPVDIDLDTLVLVLNREGIAHRLERNADVTRLWVADARQYASAREIVEQVQRLSLASQRKEAMKPPNGVIVQAYLTRLPITLSAIVLGVVGALIVKYYGEWVPWLSFQRINAIGDQQLVFEPVAKALSRGEWWRLITPAFLHFGLFHIVFNALWLWEFGRRIELLIGSSAYLVLLSALTIGANVGQYLWSGPALFGGLSGVVYGLLGYIWIRARRAPHPLLAMPGAIIPIMLVFLALGLFGVIDMFIRGGVANGAHVAGLIIGMVYGAFAGTVRRDDT